MNPPQGTRDELLADLLERLSKQVDNPAGFDLSKLNPEEMELAGELRELLGTISMTRTCLENSQITPSPLPSQTAGPLPRIFGDYRL